MDKQLMEEFNRMYFGKNQLKRRIYDEEELGIVWKSINSDRKSKSIDVGIKLNKESNIWYNVTEDIRLIIEYINDIKKSEITKYLLESKIVDKSLLSNNRDSRISNSKLLNIDYLEEFYIDKYKVEAKGSIYRNINEVVSMGGFSYEPYKLEHDGQSKELFWNLLDFLETDKSSSVIIKAAILNFYIVYLNLFLNHNLEIADYITNRYLINNGYEIIGCCRTLDLIKADERRYYSSIENSIVNEGDVTYFIKYYVGIIQSSIKELTKEVSVKYGKKIIKELIEKNNISLEDRQIKFINSMIVLSNNKIVIEDYKKKTKVSYETARSDLNELVALGFFKISKSGKKYEYYFNDIATIIDDFNDINMSI